MDRRLYIAFLTLLFPLSGVVGVCDPVEQPPIQPPSAELTFKSQVMVDMDAQVLVSPDPRSECEWEAQTGWFTGNRAHTVLVLVRISPALIDAAVEYWADGRGASLEERAAAHDRLRRLFLRDGEMAFLLLTRPLVVAEYADFWRVQLGPLTENVCAVTLDGATSAVLRAETSLDDVLPENAGIRSCLFYVRDIVDEEVDPSFNIILGGVDYFVRSNLIEDNNNQWIRNVSPATACFRMETGSINILHLVEAGLPWADIEKRYLEPQLKSADPESGHMALSILADVAINIIMALLLKI